MVRRVCFPVSVSGKLFPKHRFRCSRWILVGELHRDKGSVVVRGSIAYYNQSPFVLSDSIKQNILFGHHYDHE